MKKFRYISLGQRCNPALMLRKYGLRSASYPFDWILSPIQSISQLLSLLLTEQMSVEQLVREEFLPFDRMLGCNKFQRPPEHYVTYQDKSGRPYNVKYRQCHPHELPLLKTLKFEQYQKQSWDKYTRRFNRLKEHITCSDEPICFVMQILPAAYTVDDNQTFDPETTPVALRDIVDLLTTFNSENKFVLYGNKVPFNINTSTGPMHIHECNFFHMGML